MVVLRSNKRLHNMGLHDKLPNVLAQQLITSLNGLASHTDLQHEFKRTLLEVIRLPQDKALEYLLSQLEPTVLINADIASKRQVYHV